MLLDFLLGFRLVFNACWIVVVTFFYATFVTVTFPAQLLLRSGPWFARSWATMLCKGCGILVEVHGLEHFPTSQPLVVMTNHRSYADVISLLMIVPHYVHFIAKKELIYIPIFGLGMVSAGTILIDRGNSRKAKASLAKAASNIREGRTVLIFPEGTRSKDARTLGRYKKGGFHLARSAGVPILPGVVTKSESIMSIRQYIFRPGTVRIDFGEPIPTDNEIPMDELVETVRNRHQSMLDTIEKEA